MYNNVAKYPSVWWMYVAGSNNNLYLDILFLWYAFRIPVEAFYLSNNKHRSFEAALFKEKAYKIKKAAEEEDEE